MFTHVQWRKVKLFPSHTSHSQPEIRGEQTWPKGKAQRQPSLPPKLLQQREE